MEATGVHGAEAALHVGHHLVLGLAHDEWDDHEHPEDDDEPEGDVEYVVHAVSPPAGLGVGSDAGSGFGVSG